MSRWIDADALPRHGQRGGIVHWKDIEDAPSIDIVRCKECKRRYRSGYRGDEYWVCDFMDAKIKDDDFCSYGSSSEKPNNSEEWYTFRDEQEYNARYGKE